MAINNLKQQTKRGLYWRFAEQFSCGGIQFVVGIFMARLLSPEEFGITALPAVFMAVATIFTSAGFAQALIRKPDLSEKDLSTSFYYSLGAGILMYVLMFFAAPWIAEFYHTPILTLLIRVSAFSFIYGALRTPQDILLNRNLNFQTSAKTSFICRVLSGAIGIAMAYTGYGVWALVISSMIGDITSVMLLWYKVRWLPREGWSKTSFIYLWNFGNKMMGSWLIGTLYENIAPILIGKFFSPVQLGVYNRAAGYTNLPSQNITKTVQGVSFPVLSKIQNDDDQLQSHYRRILRVSAFVVFPLMMILAATAKPLIVLMITEKWLACVPLIQIMCLSMMWYPIHAINLNLLEVKGRSDLFFRLELIKRGMGIIILICTLPYGLEAFCWGGVASSLLCLFVNTYYTGKLIKVGYFIQMKDISGILLISVICFTVTYFTGDLFANNLPKLVFGSLCGAASYILIAYIFHFEELRDVRFLIFNK